MNILIKPGEGEQGIGPKDQGAAIRCITYTTNLNLPFVSYITQTVLWSKGKVV